MGMKVGICGAGAFSECFIPLFKAHPLVDEVVLADLIPERVTSCAHKHDVLRTFGTLEELCESDVDAIVLMTQRQLHGPQALAALQAGKHVYSAVPIGQTLEEIQRIVAEVEKTRLIYMTGETSYYYPCAVYCRQRFRNGDFGEFVYGEGQYYHDMSHFYASFQRSGGPEWKRLAGIPPMHYPTHSVSMILSVTGTRATTVSCLGFRDRHEDGIFRVGENAWDNIFSNETALMRTANGGMMRINEFRRIGWKGLASVQMSLYGTRGCYEEQADSQVWVTVDPRDLLPLNEQLACGKIPVASARKDVDEEVLRDFHQGVSQVHRVERLPREFVGLGNGHSGSHQFLVDDFVKAVVSQKLPPNHVWAAARYCIPGLTAHESANRDGALLDIPDLGDPPSDWALLDPDND
jgi:predicted dehydrogenase